jgi:glycosyltransferase involved in cell wall biosynthesis
MKKVLFLGVTRLNFRDNPPLHLEKKYRGLSEQINPYILSKGKPFFNIKWGAKFYLLPPNLFFWPGALIVSFYLCLFKKIDVIVAQSPLVEGFVGVILKKIFCKELIVEMHGDWVEGPFLSKKRKLDFLYKKFVPFLANISFKNADKIRGVAEYLIASAKKIAPDKRYFNFPTFTDLSIFLEEKDIKTDPFILFVGYLQEVKGVKYLIEAFSKIINDFPDFTLVIVGDGPEKNNLEKLSLELGIPDRVIFKGRLSLEETKNVMKDCFCFILPSLSEGLPRVIIEAMALGKPVLASNVGGIPELVRKGETGFLFNARDVDDLLRKMKNILQDRELAKKIGDKNKFFARENFSVEKYIKQYLLMINQ